MYYIRFVHGVPWEGISGAHYKFLLNVSEIQKEETKLINRLRHVPLNLAITEGFR